MFSDPLVFFRQEAPQIGEDHASDFHRPPIVPGLFWLWRSPMPAILDDLEHSFRGFPAGFPPQVAVRLFLLNSTFYHIMTSKELPIFPTPPKNWG